MRVLERLEDRQHHRDEGVRIERTLRQEEINKLLVRLAGEGKVVTRLKGGERRPPFLLDESAQVKGHAFLTSSAETEAAQESDRIWGLRQGAVDYIVKPVATEQLVRMAQAAIAG
jgi:CheY-like chemotaxis protein